MDHKWMSALRYGQYHVAFPSEVIDDIRPWATRGSGIWKVPFNLEDKLPIAVDPRHRGVGIIVRPIAEWGMTFGGPVLANEPYQVIPFRGLELHIECGQLAFIGRHLEGKTEHTGIVTSQPAYRLTTYPNNHLILLADDRDVLIEVLLRQQAPEAKDRAHQAFEDWKREFPHKETP